MQNLSASRDQIKATAALSNSAKLLSGYMKATGVSDAKTIADDLEIPLRTVLRLKLELDIASCPRTVVLIPSGRTLYRKKPIDRRLRAAVFARDGQFCKRCGSTEHLQIDHVVAEFHGGPTEYANLQVLCRSCNLRKGPCGRRKAAA